MNRSTLLSTCLAASLLACTERSAPAASEPKVVTPPAGARMDAPDSGAPLAAVTGQDAGTPDAGGLAAQPVSPDAGLARCSAASLSPETAPEEKSLPPAVASMRRRIITAAMACDYAALAALGDEKVKGLNYSFGDEGDPAAYWRQLEAGGEPILARMVQVLRLPHAKEGEQYVWPAVHLTGMKSEADWKSVEGVYSAQQLQEMRESGTGYLGLRLSITSRGDWQFAVAGD